MQIFPEINGFELVQAHRVMDEPVLRDLFVFGEFGSPVGSRKRWKDTDDRLPFGYRQTGEGEPGDPADHDHQKNQRTTNEQPSGDGTEVTLRRACRRPVRPLADGCRPSRQEVYPQWSQSTGEVSASSRNSKPTGSRSEERRVGKECRSRR